MVTGAPQMSVALTEDGSGGGTPSEAQTATFAAHCVMVGGVVSLTVMRWLAVLVLPHRSVAAQVRVMTLLQLEPGLLWVC